MVLRDTQGKALAEVWSSPAQVSERHFSSHATGFAADRPAVEVACDVSCRQSGSKPRKTAPISLARLLRQG